MSESPVYRFDRFLFDPQSGQLWDGDDEILLTRKAAEVLRLLIEQSDRVVTREQLLSEIWANSHVQENTVTFHVRLVRRAIGDSKNQERFIRTFHGRGYRFVAPVEELVRSPERKRPLTAPVRTPPTASPGTPGPSPEDVAPQKTRDGAPALGSTSGPIYPQSSGQRRLAWSSMLVLLILVMALVTVARVTQPPLPRVASVRRLTHDGLAKYRLVPLDETSLIVSSATEERIFRTDTQSFADNARFQGFEVHDVSAVNGEALAHRRNDNGAEGALWIVPARRGVPYRMGMVSTNSFAGWSPDAAGIVFARGSALFRVSRDTGELRKLADLSGIPECPQWSPDGATIRVLHVAFSDRRATGKLQDVAADGGPLRNTPDGTEPLLPGCGRWMPNGLDFVFSGAGASGDHVWLTRTGTRRWPGVKPETVRLTLGEGKFGWPVPSRDGRRLFVIHESAAQLSRLDQERQSLVPYLGGIDVMDVAFSRDRRWVAYVDGSLRLWRARMDGSETRPVTPAGFEVTAGAWSPDGATFAIRGGPAGQRQKIYFVAATGGTPEPLDLRDVVQGTPSWSPDGTRIAFGDVPERWGKATGMERIHIFDLRTKATSDIPGSDGLWTSRWSPDGRYLAAMTIGAQELRLYDFRTGQWRRSEARRANNPTWSHDGEFIYLDPEGSQFTLRRVRASDGMEERVLDLTERKTKWAGVMPDGTPLVAWRPTDIFALELEWP